MSRSIIILLLVLALSVVGIEYFFDARDILNYYQELKWIVASHYLLALACFFSIYWAATALSLPTASFLSLIGAAIFGWFVLPIIILGASLGALCVFLLAKNIFRKALTQKVNRYLLSATDAFQKSPIRWCLTMRLIPFIPFWAANILPAVLGMATTPFFFTTLIWIIPGSTIYVGLGTGLDTIFLRGEDASMFSDPSVWWPLIALGLLVALSTRLKCKINKEKT